jgi:MFS family permease
VRNPFRSRLWQNAAFARVWTAATISIFGSLITRIALPLAAILVLGSGAFEVAILRSLDLGATLLVGLVAGAWVDRLRRRPVLIWADLGRAALLGSIPIAFAFGVLSYWQLLVVSGLAAILTTFFDSASNAYLPTIVERDGLVDANGALAASGSAAEFMAFGISGFLVQLLTAPFAIAIDAVSFIASALLLGSIRRREAPPPPPEEREPVLDEIREGLRLVIHDPVLRGFAGAQMALHALWGVFGATWFLFVLDELRLDPATLGVVAGIGGASSFVGAVAIGNAFIPIAPAGLPVIAIGCLVMQQLVADSAATVYDITEISVRQTLVHDRALGRVTSTFHVGAVIAQLTATIVAGILAEAIGLRATSWLAPLGGLAGAAILWATPVRQLRIVNPPGPELAGAGPGGLVGAAVAVIEMERDQPVGG